MLAVPEDSTISFHNSPYYSHNQGSAIDLYPSNRDFGTPATSPVEGIVRSIRRFKSPTSKWFETPAFEPLILVENKDNPGLLIKILHVDPSVQEGEPVYIGDQIGTHIRSGYFRRLTDPHIHIEVRHRSDPIRARGGFPIRLLNGNESKPFAFDQIRDISGRFSLITDDYALVELDSPLPMLGYYSGLAASLGDVSGVLDCGIPHYRFGGLHLPSMSRVDSLDILKIGDNVVGRVCKSVNGFIVFETLNPKIMVNTIPILGLSLGLHVGDSRTIKVIPVDPLSFPFVEGDKAEISI
jgi:murein DD-endopeptidase MepM/ murein hydrolase activator NlpD